MSQILQEITLGENICQKLKEIYFKDIEWSKCYLEVAKKLTTVKQKMRKLHNTTDTLAVLKLLQKFTPEDLKEVLDIY